MCVIIIIIIINLYVAFRGAQIWCPELMHRSGVKFRIAKPDELISVTEKETVHLNTFSKIES